MTIQITPETSGVWRLRATVTKNAVVSSDNRIFIPPFDTGHTYYSQFIAVGIQVSQSRDNWRNGGYLSQEYKFNCVGYTHNNKAFNRSQDLLINEVTILNLPLLSDSEYRLRYFPPTYFSDVKIQIWEYVGVQIDVLLRDLTNFLLNAPSDLLINLSDLNDRLDTDLNYLTSQFLEIKERLNSGETKNETRQQQLLTRLAQLSVSKPTSSNNLQSQAEALKQTTQNRLNLDLGLL